MGWNDWCSEDVLDEVRVGIRESELDRVPVHDCYIGFSADYSLDERLIVRRKSIIL